jgi:lipid-A-disaccharide synthase
MKYYIIAGEASADLHGSNLMRGILQADPDADFRYLGGDKMQSQGGELVKHYRELALMGIGMVILKFRTITRNISFCKQDIKEFQPDVVILIDLAGFNLKVARYVKKLGIRVFYYISPKVWAWNSSRVKTIKELVDKMFVIFPFEVGFYREHDYEVEYHGNPLLDAITDKKNEPDARPAFTKHNNLSDKPIIDVLPGSRKQEIDLLLPEMMAVIPDFPGYQFVIAGAPGIDPDYYNKFISSQDVPVLYEQTYDLLKYAEAAIVTSGTATLETALMNVPEVVCYKAGKFTYHVGKHFVKPKFFSLVNIIMDKEIVKELLQFNLARNISVELNRILNDSSYRNSMLEHFAGLRETLGAPGASYRLGRRIFELISE